MGIPSYYKNTIQNYPEIIIPDNKFLENSTFLSIFFKSASKIIERNNLMQTKDSVL